MKPNQNNRPKKLTVLEKLIPEINESASDWMRDPAAALECVEFLIDISTSDTEASRLLDFTGQLAEVGRILAAMDSAPARSAYLSLATYMLALSKTNPTEFCNSSLRRFFADAAEAFQCHSIHVELLLGADTCTRDYPYILDYTASDGGDLPRLTGMLAAALADRDLLAIVRALSEISSPEDGFVPSTAAEKLFAWGLGYAAGNGPDGEQVKLDMCQVAWRTAVRIAALAKKHVPPVAIDALRVCLAADRETEATVSHYCCEMPDSYPATLLAPRA